MTDTFDPETIRWVIDDDHLPGLLDAVRASSCVVIDLETTGLDEHAVDPVPARVVLASLTLPRSPDDEDPPTYVIPLSHPDSPLHGWWRMALIKLCKAMMGKPIVNHNLKFDLRWLYAMTGLDLSRQYAWDTQLSSHLLDENSSTRLKERAPTTFGIDRWDEDFDLTQPGAAERVPLFDLGVYAARDTYWTWRLAQRHQRTMWLGDHAGDEPIDPEDFENARLGKLSRWCVMPTGASLTAIEQRGIALDVEWVRDEIAAEQALRDDTYDRLVGLYGDPDPEREPSLAPTSLWFKAWTERAVEAGDLRVISYTDTGKPQWSKSVLTRLARAARDRGEKVNVPQLLLDHRQSVKGLEFLMSWLAEVTPNGRIHTSYHAGRVVSGRLSSSSPNMQQVTGRLKPAFIPSPGHVLAELDYSQVEMRAAAHVAKCTSMIEAFQKGDDLHRLLAARVTGKAPEDVTPEERQGGKAGNFGFLFGMGAEGFRDYAENTYGVSFTHEEAEDVYRAFFDQWPEMAVWHARTIQRARIEGQVVSPIGRVRRVPEVWGGDSGRAERQAINSPVQGFASDMMQMAAASIGGFLPILGPVTDARVVGTVHDSIVLEAPADSWEEVVGECIERMTNLSHILRNLGCTLLVPLEVEAKIGTRWGLSDVGEMNG